MLREDKTMDSIPHNQQPEDLTGSLSESDLRLRLKTFPKDAQSWFLLGKLLQSNSKLRLAEDALRKAISINPSPPHFWLELANVLDELGVNSEATDIRQELVAKAKEVDVSSLHGALQASRKENSLVSVSPCISCSYYTYYGCRKKEQCSELIEWREKILHP